MQERDKFNTSCREHSVEITIDHVTRHIAWKRDDCPVCRIIRLEQQLSEAREEVERLKSQPTGYYDNTKDVEQARQEAAREILAILRADRWAESELAGIKAKFGLEG